MKNILLVFSFVAIAATVSAQDNKWNIGFGGGVASPMGSDFKETAKIGAGYYVNGTYNFTPKFAAGLEFNGAALVGASLGDDAGGVKAGATTISAYLAKGVYYFTETKVRPYGAVMAGMYNIGVGSTNADLGNGNSFETESTSKTNFGFGAELGLKIKWFNLGIAYHNAGKADGVSTSYMQYNVGFNIGF